MSPGQWEPDRGPVDDRTTLLAHALALHALHGPGPWPDGGFPLPDEPPRRNGEDGPLITSVVLDGVRTHHFGTASEPAAITQVADLLEAAVSAFPDPASLARLHAVLARQPAVDLADDLVEELRSHTLPREPLHGVARHLTEYGRARNAVKLGIVVLGECGDERDRELLLLLGALEELTLYAVVALVKTQPDPQRAAYELAQRVKNWGRIHAVERLEGSNDPEIQAWLLREGFRNGVLNEYLAHIAATTGDLYTALLESEVDQALLKGAGNILATLALIGGPAKDMTDYDDAVPAMHRYAELAATAEPTLDMLHDLLTINRCALQHDAGIDWPRGEPEHLTHRYEELLARPVWRELVLAVLNNPHTYGPYGFETALSCAGRLKLPVVAQALRHLEQDPSSAYVWSWVVKHSNSETAGSVIALAMRILPLDVLTSGPTVSRGLGPEHTLDRVLAAVINDLDEHPGAGVELLRRCLSARTTPTRRRALQILTAWPPEHRPSRLRDWISAAASAEPDSKLQEEMQAFLPG
ncbi:hypothetical protein [Actinomadura chokoriensis]|uniref:hypothetical protein n=1 Tax=Actinomadura chokoriensis TaxID=454156 RepID=UPI0031F81097